jgi:hypothetical protein
MQRTVATADAALVLAAGPPAAARLFEFIVHMATSPIRRDATSAVINTAAKPEGSPPNHPGPEIGWIVMVSKLGGIAASHIFNTYV